MMNGPEVNASLASRVSCPSLLDEEFKPSLGYRRPLHNALQNMNYEAIFLPVPLAYGFLKRTVCLGV